MDMHGNCLFFFLLGDINTLLSHRDRRVAI